MSANVVGGSQSCVIDKRYNHGGDLGHTRLQAICGPKVMIIDKRDRPESFAVPWYFSAEPDWRRWGPNGIRVRPFRTTIRESIRWSRGNKCG